MWATPPEQAVVPPCTAPFSQTTTEAPTLRAPAVAARAAAPLPTTTTSNVSGAGDLPVGERAAPGRWGSWASSATRAPSDAAGFSSAILCTPGIPPRRVRGQL